MVNSSQLGYVLVEWAVACRSCLGLAERSSAKIPAVLDLLPPKSEASELCEQGEGESPC